MSKITDLTELTSGNLHDDDLLEVVDVSDTSMAATGTNKKAKVSTLRAAGMGNWQLLSTTTISGSPTNLDFALSGSYRRYRLELEGVTHSSPFSYILRMQTSTDGGSTFDSSSDNYGYSYGPLGSYAPVSTTGTYMQLLPDSLIGFTAGVWGEIDFYDPLNASTHTFAKWNLFGRFWAYPATNYVLGSGVRDSAADVDAVRLFWATGTFAGGKVRLFGWSE